MWACGLIDRAIGAVERAAGRFNSWLWHKRWNGRAETRRKVNGPARCGIAPYVGATCHWPDDKD